MGGHLGVLTQDVSNHRTAHIQGSVEFVVHDTLGYHVHSLTYLATDVKHHDTLDFWQGANFKLKIRKVDGYWNYDKSEFDSPGALLDDDDALEALWKKEYSLNALVAQDQFKTYEELQTRLDYVLGRKGTPRLQDEEVQDEDNMRGNFTPSFGGRQQESELPKELKQELNNLSSDSGFNSPDIMAKSSSDSTEEEDDALSYFQKLAES